MGKHVESKTGQRGERRPDQVVLGVERHQKRLKVDQVALVDRLHFPERVNKQLAALMEHYDQYEGIAEIIHTDPSQEEVVLETLLSLGAFNSDAIRLQHRLVGALTHHNIQGYEGAVEKVFDASRDAADARGQQIAARDQARIGARANEAGDTFLRRYSSETSALRDRALAMKRYLFHRALVESFIEVANLRLMRVVEKRLEEEVIKHPEARDLFSDAREAIVVRIMNEIGDDMAKSNPEEMLVKAYGANHFAMVANHRGRLTENEGEHFGELHEEAVLQWLQTVDFDRSNEPESFPIHGLTMFEKKLTGRLYVTDQLSPLSVAGFDVFINGTNIGFAGEISRVTGDLTPNMMSIGSMRNIFDRWNSTGSYELIRQALITSVYRKYEREQVPESQRTVLRELLSTDPRRLAPSLEQTPSAQSTSVEQEQSKLESQVVTQPISEPPVKSEPSTVAVTPVATTEVVEKVKREVRVERAPRLSVKQVRARLIRLGAQIITGEGGHSKFVGPRKQPIPFFNKHSGQLDRMLYRNWIESYVEELGFDVESFWKA